MKTALAAILSCIALTASLSVNASMFELDHGGVSGIHPNSWDPTGYFDPDLSQRDAITKHSDGRGIKLNGAGKLVYTYIGKEAGSTNRLKWSTSSNVFITADYRASSDTEFFQTKPATQIKSETWETVFWLFGTALVVFVVMSSRRNVT